jgi:hypothetical protein
MTASVALPPQPTEPTGITAPVLQVATAPMQQSQKEAKPGAALLKRGKEVAKALEKFLTEDPEQAIQLEGGWCPRKSAVQFVGLCFGTTAMVTASEPIMLGESLMGFTAIAHALDACGRVISGAAAECMYSEKFWTGKDDFQLRSMAQTRACSKVICNLYSWVFVLAGLTPTPAEEMDPSEPVNHREFKTQCDKCDCPNMISEKRRTETRRKYGQALCVECEKKHKAEKAQEVMNPIADPKFVEQSIAQVKQRKANGNGAAQPIVKVLDKMKEEIA